MNRLAGGALLTLLLCAAAWLAGRFEYQDLWADNLNHLHPHLTVVALLATPWLWWLGPRRSLKARILGILFGMSLSAWGIVGMLPLVASDAAVAKAVEPTEPRSASPTTTLRVASINVQTSNRNSAAVLAWLRATKPDVVALLEVDKRWMNDLAPLSATYPHRLVRARGDNFGVALLSRLPLSDPQVHLWGKPGLPALEATVTAGDQPLTIFAVHTEPPVVDLTFQHRNATLSALASRAQAKGAAWTPVVVLGDLNVTRFSPWFRGLTRSAKLRSARLGRGWQPTWPTWLPRALGIAIDHVLVSEAVQVMTFARGPNVGSDHLPIAVQLRL